MPGESENLLLLLGSLFRCLVSGSVDVDRCGWDDGEKGLEKKVGTLGVEVHRQRSVELCGWDAEGYYGNRDGRTGNFGSRLSDGAERRKVGAVGSKHNVVGWVESNLVATVGGSVVGLGRIDSEHVGGHLGREIVDHDSELLRESGR